MSNNKILILTLALLAINLSQCAVAGVQNQYFYMRYRLGNSSCEDYIRNISYPAKAVIESLGQRLQNNHSTQWLNQSRVLLWQTARLLRACAGKEFDQTGSIDLFKNNQHKITQDELVSLHLYIIAYSRSASEGKVNVTVSLAITVNTFFQNIADIYKGGQEEDTKRNHTLAFNHTQSRNWYGETTNFTLKAPFNFTVNFTVFPDKERQYNFWGSLIGIGTRSVKKSLANLWMDNQFYFMNVLEGRKVHNSGQGLDWLRIRQPYKKLEVRLTENGELQYQIAELNIPFQTAFTVDPKIPYYIAIGQYNTCQFTVTYTPQN